MTAIPDHMLEAPDDEETCSIHDIPYRIYTGCPACRDEAADRQYDSKREDRR